MIFTRNPKKKGAILGLTTPLYTHVESVGLFYSIITLVILLYIKNIIIKITFYNS